MDSRSTSQPVLDHQPDRLGSHLLAPHYLVILHIGHRQQRLHWNAHEPLHLTHPKTHFLSADDQGFQLQNVERPEKTIRIPYEIVENGSVAKAMGIQIQILKISPPKAVFDLVSKTTASRKESKIFVFAGAGSVVSDSSVLENSFQGVLGGRKIFRIRTRNDGIEITAGVSNLELKIGSNTCTTLQPKTPTLITHQQGSTLSVNFGDYWWKVNRIECPLTPALDRARTSDPDAESIAFQRFSKIGVFVASALLAFTMLVPNKKPVEVKEEPITVQLKRPPKVIAKKPEPKKPEPKKIVELKKEKKVEPKKIVKIEKKPTPKKPEPPKQLAKKLPPPPVKKPNPIVKAPPKPAAAPKQIAMQPVKPATPVKPAITPPTAQQLRAAAQAKVAASLGFLSAATSKAGNKPAPFAADADPKAKYQALAKASAQFGKANNSMLVSMASATGTGNLPINTNAARNLSSDSGISEGRRKGLNEVQGKVALNDLYDPKSSNMGASVSGGGGLSTSGPGSVSDSEIMKVLEKYMQRFQYCYERGLLAKPMMKGSLTMQWTIQTSGRANDVKIAKSELNDNNVHGCLQKEMGKIAFPIPKGGMVTVKFPFKFESSAL